jgi:hypothetical protein
MQLPAPSFNVLDTRMQSFSFAGPAPRRPLLAGASSVSSSLSSFSTDLTASTASGDIVPVADPVTASVIDSSTTGARTSMPTLMMLPVSNPGDAECESSLHQPCVRVAPGSFESASASGAASGANGTPSHAATLCEWQTHAPPQIEIMRIMHAILEGLVVCPSHTLKSCS